MDIVLIAGMWLDATAWEDVVPELERLGHRPVAVTLPGQGDGDTTATYADQVAAVTAAVDAADGVVHLSDDRRYHVPLTMVCPEFTPDQAKEWVEAGEIPELAKARRVDYVDIDAGHWPMYTKPVELARILADCTGA